jgi:hypothetical protein
LVAEFRKVTERSRSQLFDPGGHIPALADVCERAITIVDDAQQSRNYVITPFETGALKLLMAALAIARELGT